MVRYWSKVFLDATSIPRSDLDGKVMDLERKKERRVGVGALLPSLAVTLNVYNTTLPCSVNLTSGSWTKSVFDVLIKVL